MGRGKTMERLTESWHSQRNRLFWRLRLAVAFRRRGYLEEGGEGAVLPAAAASLEKKYALRPLRRRLTRDVYLKNLATLHSLERLLPQPISPATVLEPGCQDFARLPALSAFFPKALITGVEIDPYPVLRGFHSRFDKAEYYRSLGADPGRHHYRAGDFFRWHEPADLVIAFYPFVSANPALAWGLPKEFGRPEPWIASFRRNLKPGGTLVVVHQGEWEQEAFDEARRGKTLELVKREDLTCPFYPLPYPACGSVYRDAR